MVSHIDDRVVGRFGTLTQVIRAISIFDRERILCPGPVVVEPR
jgi:hypothetical protein